MALNSTGPISLAGTTAGQSIEIENGGNGTTQISLNDTAVRTLAGVPSGAITMPTNFYGKSNAVTVNLTISTNTKNYNIKTAAGASYSAGKTIVNVTINSGIIVGSTSTASYGMTTGTGWSGSDQINIINNGYIVGKGGSTSNGGPALQMFWPVGVTNASGYIYGGGGGGSGGASATTTVGHTEGGAPITRNLVSNGGGGGAGNSAGAGQHVSGGLNVNRPGAAGGLTRGGNGGAGAAGGALNNPGVGSGGGGGGKAAGGGQAAGAAITKNGYTLTFVSGSSRVYGTVS